MCLYQNSPFSEVEVRYIPKIQMKEINTFESVDVLDHSVLQLLSLNQICQLYQPQKVLLEKHMILTRLQIIQLLNTRNTYGSMTAIINKLYPHSSSHSDFKVVYIYSVTKPRMEMPKIQFFVVGISPRPFLCVSMIVIVQFQVIQNCYRNKLMVYL